jgi:hypothetical protein
LDFGNVRIYNWCCSAFNHEIWEDKMEAKKLKNDKAYLRIATEWGALSYCA